MNRTLLPQKIQLKHKLKYCEIFPARRTAKEIQGTIKNARLKLLKIVGHKTRRNNVH